MDARTALESGSFSALVRAARALLGWSAQDLADASHVGVATIRRVECGKTNLTIANAQRLMDELGEAGVDFVGDNEGIGVRLRMR